MKKILCLTMAVILALSLCACKRQCALVGDWTLTTEVDPHAAIEMMRNMSLCDEELSLVVTPLYTVKYITFQQDGSFSCYQDSETEKQCVRDFYKAVFDALYDGRAYLSDVYQIDFENSTKEDFIRFYTDLYSVPDYEALIEKFVNRAYDYTSFGELFAGSYTEKNGVITLDATDDAYDSTVSYTVKDDVLTLINGETTVIYIKK